MLLPLGLLVACALLFLTMLAVMVLYEDSAATGWSLVGALLSFAGIIFCTAWLVAAKGRAVHDRRQVFEESCQSCCIQANAREGAQCVPACLALAPLRDYHSPAEIAAHCAELAVWLTPPAVEEE